MATPRSADTSVRPPIEAQPKSAASQIPGRDISIRTRPESFAGNRATHADYPLVTQGDGVAAAAKLADRPEITFRTLEELASFASQKGAPVLKVHIENDMHLIRMEPGRIEFRPTSKAPHTLAADLAQKLKDWTGVRWVVSVSREGGKPTIAEAKRAAAQAKLDAIAQEPLVRAVLDRFPGAEIVGVHDQQSDTTTNESTEDNG